MRYYNNIHIFTYFNYHKVKFNIANKVMEEKVKQPTYDVGCTEVKSPDSDLDLKSKGETNSEPRNLLEEPDAIDLLERIHYNTNVYAGKILEKILLYLESIGDFDKKGDEKEKTAYQIMKELKGICLGGGGICTSWDCIAAECCRQIKSTFPKSKLLVSGNLSTDPEKIKVNLALLKEKKLTINREGVRMWDSVDITGLIYHGGRLTHTFFIKPAKATILPTLCLELYEEKMTDEYFAKVFGEL
jgi:hypothetical protein